MKKVLVDLDLLDRLEEKGDLNIQCSYPYHPENDGVASLREIAAYAAMCRQCKSANCVLACPKEALEKDEEGILRRHNMRCISCKSCAVACPFGTIYPSLVPFAVARCDYCTERLKPGEEPLCVRTSPPEAIQYLDIEPDESKNIHKVGDNLLVKCEVWER